jgi:hypothetical protein
MNFDNYFDKDFDNIDIFNNNINNDNIINTNFLENYIKELYENIKNEISSIISIELLNDNMIYINFKINHIIDFAILTITFNYVINEYVLSLILYHISTRKMKKIDKKITDSKNDSIRILNNISTISDYILVDFLFIHFS